MSAGLEISIWRVVIAIVIGIGSMILLHWGFRNIEKHLNKSASQGERLKRDKENLHSGKKIV
jgi:hypothetical protein